MNAVATKPRQLAGLTVSLARLPQETPSIEGVSGHAEPIRVGGLELYGLGKHQPHWMASGDFFSP